MEEIDNSVIRIFRVTDRDEKFMMKNILPKQRFPEINFGEIKYEYNQNGFGLKKVSRMA